MKASNQPKTPSACENDSANRKDRKWWRWGGTGAGRVPSPSRADQEPAPDLRLFDALCRHAGTIAEDLPRVRALRELVGWPGDLSFPQWISWYALCLDFRPTLIIELGRGYGNSTALFAQAATRLENTSVHSYCRSDVWQNQVAPRLASTMPRNWFAPLHIHTTDIIDCDFGHVTEGHRRILLLWDAHGFDVADQVLGHIMPLLARAQHIVICHDISDNRYHPAHAKYYAGKRLWRGMQDWYENQESTAHFNLTWATGVIDQIIPILDFCYRNEAELQSADHVFWMQASENPGGLERLGRLIGEGIGAQHMRLHYAFFTLNGCSNLTFPAPAEPNDAASA